VRVHWPWTTLPGVPAHSPLNFRAAPTQLNSVCSERCIKILPLAQLAFRWLGQALEPGDEFVESGKVESGKPVKAAHFFDGVFIPPRHGSAPLCYLAEEPSTVDLRGALGAAVLWYLAERGTVQAHAASLLLEGRAILVLGDSGTGKSTLSIAWMLGIDKVISDDAVLLLNKPAGSGLEIEAWRADVSLRRPCTKRLPDPWQKLLEADLLDSNRWWLRRARVPQAFADTAELAALAILAPVAHRRRRSRLRATHKSMALAHLYAGNGYLRGSELNDDTHIKATAHRAASQFPVFELETGFDLLNEPAAEAARIKRMFASSV
jgi:hypothetical protein